MLGYLAVMSSWANVTPPAALMACKRDHSVGAVAGKDYADGPLFLDCRQ